MGAKLPEDPADLALGAQRRLARTINIGPDFGAPQERGWTTEIESLQFEACAQAGFSAVRLLLLAAAHRAAGGLEPAMLRRLEAIVDEATNLGLAVDVAAISLSEPGADLAGRDLPNRFRSERTDHQLGDPPHRAAHRSRRQYSSHPMRLPIRLSGLSG